MAKPLRDITKHGINSSKEVPNDLTNLAMSPEGNKGEIEFAKKHKIQRKDDVAGNGDEIYNASKIKTAPYKKQDQKVYEATECNKSGEGVSCPTHEMAACPGSEPKDSPKKGQKVLLDKQVKEGRIEDDAQRRAAKKLSDIAKSSNVPVTKLKPSKKSYNEIKSAGQMFGGARQFAAGLAKRNIEAGSERAASITKAKVGGKLKEEVLDEVAPPNPKIEKWIKANKERFVKEYGKEKGIQVLYAKAWKMHGQSESGAATETDYAGPGAAGWSTGRHDVGTL
jgi:hypothetical protein